jgi:hypothetical protein
MKWNEVQSAEQELTLISLLERQIQQEINRLDQSGLIDWEKETARLTIYQQLTQTILENHV